MPQNRNNKKQKKNGIKTIDRIIPFAINDKIVHFVNSANYDRIGQVHRVVNNIEENFGYKKNCTEFLDVTQAFDKMQHRVLLLKIKKNIQQYFKIMKPCLIS